MTKKPSPESYLDSSTASGQETLQYFLFSVKNIKLVTFFVSGFYRQFRNCHNPEGTIYKLNVFVSHQLTLYTASISHLKK